jgi:hypothetical protein
VVTENEWLRLPLNQNILAVSPYLIIHDVHRVQQPTHLLALPAPNIQQQVLCDPGANIIATNNINVLRDTVELEHLFPITSADHTMSAMTALVRGTFAIRISNGSTCNIPMYYSASLSDTIVSLQHFTSPVIQDLRYNGYCLIDLSV